MPELSGTAFLADLAAALEWDGGTLVEKTKLAGHEKWDSLGVLNAMTYVEDEFGLTLDFKAIERVVTVGDLLDLVAGRLDAQVT